MALPHAITLTCREKSNSDGTNTNVRFEAATTETNATRVGSFEMLLPDAWAADLAVNTDVTCTFS